MIADFKGTEKRKKLCLLAGILTLGTWAKEHKTMVLDAHAMQVPNLMNKVGYKNKRTIRVVLWANEEFGLDGAKNVPDGPDRKGFITG